MIKGPDKSNLRGKRLVLAHSSRETQSVTTGKARAGAARGQDQQTGNVLCIHTQETDMEVEWTVNLKAPPPEFTSFSKFPPIPVPQASQTAPPNGDQALKHKSPQGHFTCKPHQSLTAIYNADYRNLGDYLNLISSE